MSIFKKAAKLVAPDAVEAFDESKEAIEETKASYDNLSDERKEQIAGVGKKLLSPFSKKS